MIIEFAVVESICFIAAVVSLLLLGLNNRRRISRIEGMLRELAIEEGYKRLKQVFEKGVVK